MEHNLTRRSFVSALAGSAAALPITAGLARADNGNDEFSFLLLGDTHFDRLEHHDFSWMREHYAKDIRQVENYCRHTGQFLPKILDSAKATLNRSRLARPFVLHVGDLVEGICGNRELATRHCQEAWEFLQQVNFMTPFFMTKGNHDITGPGAVEAYRTVLLANMAKQLASAEPSKTSFAVRQADSLIAIYDAYDPTAIDWLKQVVQQNNFRHLFVLLHLPVIPYNARSTWRVYSHPRQAEQRQRLVDLLGRHRAIVLSGHLHKYSILVRRCQTGRFVQLGLSSIHKDSAAEGRLLSGTKAYGPDLVDLEPQFDPDSATVRRQTLAEEKPFIEHFEYSDTAGYAIVHVRNDRVQADIYRWPEPRPWKQLALSDLVASTENETSE